MHFAWELAAAPARGLKARVRRIRYELGPIGPSTASGSTEDGRAIPEQVAGADGDPVPTLPLIPAEVPAGSSAASPRVV